MLIRPITIGLVAGETSGDILGAGLIRALRYHIPKAHFVGIAGPCMQSEGMESWYNMEELTIMGFFEVIARLPRLLHIRYDLIRRFTILQPDIFIGIDSPDFNLTLENRLKQRGIRTIHYVSPSIWAWRQKRIFKIASATNKVLILMPFEKVFYTRHNIPCQFVGHALADIIPLYPNKNAARQSLGIASNEQCLALLPGSRKNEILLLSTVFLRAAEKLYQYTSRIKIIVPLVNLACRIQFEKIKSKVAPTLPIQILDNQASQAMIAADIALITSGTASLECMLAKCPMVVGYRMNPLTFALAKKIVKTQWISLPNILARRELVKEFLQDQCKPDILAAALLSLLNDNDQRKTMLATFRKLHKQIRCNANEQAARAVLTLINC